MISDRASKPEHFSPRVLPSSEFLDGYGLVGVSYRTADLDLRSRLGFSSAGAKDFLFSLKVRGVKECVVLSTCNRTEIYYSGRDREEIESALEAFSGVSKKTLERNLYRKSGADAVLHLFRVASGLDSAVLGETEILSQIKEAWNRSRESGLLWGRLELMLQKSLVASKRVRTETELSRHVTSVGTLAVKEAARFRGGFTENRVLLIGAGKTAERVAKEILAHGVEELTIANRTLSHAERLAGLYRGHAVPFDHLSSALAAADVVFVAVSVESALLTGAILAGREKELLIVDLSVPRACAESVGDLGGVRLLNLDALTLQCGLNTERRLAEVPKCTAILEQELNQFTKACSTREASSSIQRIQRRAESVRQENIQFLAPKIETLSSEARAIVEELSLRMVKGLIQNPIQKLRDPSLNPAQREMIAEAFGASEAVSHRD